MIGGNTTAEIQTYTKNGKNEIGEPICEWKTVQSITGWLDLIDGDSKTSSFNTKIQESTHIFISDYEPVAVKPENSRLVDEDGLIYDILLIDDPMKLHMQLEIYLKYTGGQ